MSGIHLTQKREEKMCFLKVKEYLIEFNKFNGIYEILTVVWKDLISLMARFIFLVTVWKKHKKTEFEWFVELVIF